MKTKRRGVKYLVFHIVVMGSVWGLVGLAVGTGISHDTPTVFPWLPYLLGGLFAAFAALVLLINFFVDNGSRG